MATKYVVLNKRKSVIPPKCDSWGDALREKLPWVDIIESGATPGKFFLSVHYFPKGVYTGHYVGNLQNAIRIARHRLEKAMSIWSS